MIFERMKLGSEDNAKALEKQLETFAHAGLRTLCLAIRVLSEAEYKEWNEK